MVNHFTHPSKHSRLTYVIAIVLAMCAIVAFANPPASAQASEIATNDFTVVPLSSSEARTVAAKSTALSDTSSGIVPNSEDVEGVTISDGTDSVTFVSYGLGTTDGQRSFIGQYFDQAGNAGQVVEVVYSADGKSRVWDNGKVADATAMKSTVQAQAQYNVSAIGGHSTCWWLYKYTEGEIAWGTFVAAVGGVAALFSGPIGAAIVAAGGLKAAQGGLNKWVVSLFCPSSEA